MATRELGPVVTELRRNFDTHWIQWRPKSIGNWMDLVPLQELIGHNIELRQNPYDAKQLQWHVKGLNPDDDWKHLFDLSDLKGDPGPQGDAGSAANISQLTYTTHIVFEPSYVTARMVGSDIAKQFHFDFYLEDVSHAINEHNEAPYSAVHAPLRKWVQDQIDSATTTLEWTGGTLYLKKPNGDIASFVDIASSDVTITGFWKCPTPSI